MASGVQVSVVIPVYNAEAYVAACLDSVLAQTFSDFEVIAIDDGSRDGSLEVLRRYEPRVRVLTQSNSGVSATRNRAVASAHGDLVAFIDADDLWDPDKLQVMVRLMDLHPRCLVAYHAVRLIDSVGTVTESSDAEGSRWVSGDVLLGLILGRTQNCFSPSQAIVRREALLAVGGFPLGIRQAEDYGLWLKLAARGPMLYLAEVMGSYRRHPGSVSIEANNEYGRALGRFAALMSIRGDLETRSESQLRTLFKAELLDASMTLGWFARRQRDWRTAAKAYEVVVETVPRHLTARTRLYHARSMGRLLKRQAHDS